MAMELDRDLVRDTETVLIYDKLGVLQLGRLARAYLVRGIDPIIDANGTDGTVAARAINFVMAEIPEGTPHPVYGGCQAREYQFQTINTPGMGEVIVRYIFDSPLNSNYTIDLDSWVEAVDSQMCYGTDNDPPYVLQLGVPDKNKLVPIAVRNYQPSWVDPDKSPPNPAKYAAPSLTTATRMIPRSKWIVKKQILSLQAQVVQGLKNTYLGCTNSLPIFGEAVGTVLCNRIATSTEVWLGRSTISCEFLVRTEGWLQQQRYNNSATNGIPSNLWPAHIRADGTNVDANGVVMARMQAAVDLNQLLAIIP